MEGNKNNTMRDYLPRIKADMDLKIPMVGSFLFLSFFMKFLFQERFPTTIIFLVLFIILYTFFIMLAFNKFEDESPGLIVDLYFVGTCLDVLSLTIIIYFLGGLTWIGPFFYSLVIINIFWFLPVDKAIFVVGLSFFSLVSLIWVEYFEVVSNFYIFSPEENIQNFYYVFTTVLGAATIIFFLSYASNIYRHILDDKIKNLKMAERQLQEVKEGLSIEVQERTENLEKEKRRLEEEVGKETKELEKRKKIVQARVEELEKFHAIAIERELEMVRLKEKISNFKNKK